MYDDIDLPNLDKINGILDIYHKGIGVTLTIDDSDISKYTNYSQDQLRSIDAEECQIAAGLLIQKAAQLQLEINKHIRTKNWAEECIKHHIAPHLENYDKFMPYDVRKTLAAQNHQYTYKLVQLSRAAQLYIDSLNYMPTMLKNQADFLLNLARSKHKYET